MKKIRLLTIEFENILGLEGVPAFRNEVARIAGMESILFHNHLEGKFRYAYPLIQYKSLYDKAAVVCLEDGVDEVHVFFQKKNRQVTLNRVKQELVIARMHMNQFNMQAWQSAFQYKIKNWLPFNQANYRTFSLLDGEDEKQKFLEKILIGNILSFAKGLNWKVERQITLAIKEVPPPTVIKVKDTLRQAYTVNFNCNVFLPNFIGLGKNVSIGFGIVKQINQNKDEQGRRGT
jgi:hypothetical protein